MTQNDINRAVASVTGETVSEIARRGFVLDRESFQDEPEEFTIDWDAQEARRQSA